MITSIRSYYDVLGVTADTPPVVIKAAYRALAKEYHPDSGADTAADTDRFIELQSAYAVLSDPAARNAYDMELREALARTMPEAEPALPTVQKPFAGVWSHMRERSAAIQVIYSRFCLYSEDLAAAFQEAVVEGRPDAELSAYAQDLEGRFFRQYFGDDPDVQALARLLLLRSQRAAVVELNDLMARGTVLTPAEARAVLAQFVERNLSGEGLFSEWLKAKYAEKGHAARNLEHEESVTVVAETPAPAPRGRPLRTFVRLFCWACAMYFGVFALMSFVG